MPLGLIHLLCRSGDCVKISCTSLNNCDIQQLFLYITRLKYRYTLSFCFIWKVARCINTSYQLQFVQYVAYIFYAYFLSQIYLITWNFLLSQYHVFDNLGIIWIIQRLFEVCNRFITWMQYQVDVLVVKILQYSKNIHSRQYSTQIYNEVGSHVIFDSHNLIFWEKHI